MKRKSNKLLYLSLLVIIPYLIGLLCVLLLPHYLMIKVTKVVVRILGILLITVSTYIFSLIKEDMHLW